MISFYICYQLLELLEYYITLQSILLFMRNLFFVYYHIQYAGAEDLESLHSFWNLFCNANLLCTNLVCYRIAGFIDLINLKLFQLFMGCMNVLVAILFCTKTFLWKRRNGKLIVYISWCFPLMVGSHKPFCPFWARITFTLHFFCSDYKLVILSIV